MNYEIRKMKILCAGLLFLILYSSFFIQIVSAQGEPLGYPIQVGLPGVPTGEAGKGVSLKVYIEAIYKLILGLVVIGALPQGHTDMGRQSLQQGV